MFRRALELENEIERVQKSTKTLFGFFSPVHNWLRMKSRYYYGWSMKPYSHAVHWTILVLMILSSPLAFLNSNGNINQTKAAGSNRTEAFQSLSGFNNVSTTAKIDTTTHKARMGYMEEPNYLGTSNIPMRYIYTDRQYLQSVFVKAEKSVTEVDEIYLFGGKSIDGAYSVVRYSPNTKNSVLVQDVNIPDGYIASDITTKTVYDEDDNVAVIYTQSKVFTFDFSIEKFSPTVATTPTFNFAGDAVNPAASGNLLESIPVYIPLSSTSQYKGKVLFIGGGIGSDYYSSYLGSGEVNVFDPTSSQFVGKVSDATISMQLPYKAFALDGTQVPNSNSNIKDPLSISPQKAKAEAGSDGSGVDCTNPDIQYSFTGTTYGEKHQYITANNIWGGRAYYENDRIVIYGDSKYYYFSNNGTAEIVNVYTSPEGCRDKRSSGDFRAYTGFPLDKMSGRESYSKVLYFDLSNKTLRMGGLGATAYRSSGAVALANSGDSYPTLISYGAGSNYTTNYRPGDSSDTSVSYSNSGLSNYVQKDTITSSGTDSTIYLFYDQGDGNDIGIVKHNISSNTLDDGGVNYGSSSSLVKNFLSLSKGTKTYFIRSGQNISYFDSSTEKIVQTQKTVDSNPLNTSIGAYSGTADKFYLFAKNTSSNIVYSANDLGGDDPNASGTPFSPVDVTLNGNLASSNFKILNGSATECGTKICLVASYSTYTGGFSYKTGIFVFDPAQNTLDVKVDNLSPVIMISIDNVDKFKAVGASDGIVYIFYGTKIMKFDPADNSVTTILTSGLPSYAYNNGSTYDITAVSSNNSGKIFLQSGYPNYYAYIFDTTTNAFTKVSTQLKRDHRNGTVVANGDQLYFIGGNTEKVETADIRIDSTANVVQSANYIITTDDTYRVDLSAECNTDTKSCVYPDGRKIDFQLSVDGGQTWKNVNNNSSAIFTKNSLVDNAKAAGTNLCWRAILSGTTYASPELTKVSTVFYAKAGRLLFGSTIDENMKYAGSPSNPMSIFLYGSGGYSTVAYEDTTITLSSDSSTARFSTSDQGPWTNTLSLPVQRDNTPPQYYYLNYASGSHKIFAEAPGLYGTSRTVKTLVGNINQASPISFSRNNVEAGGSVGISVHLTDNQATNPDNITGKTIEVYSSDSRDQSPLTTISSDTDGVYSGTISSKYAGQKSISIKVLPDNIWIEAPEKLTFLPAGISSINLSTNPKQSVRAGENFILSSSFYDGFGNLTTNLTDNLTLSSTDQSFVPINYKLTGADSGRHDFSNISLKSSGKQTLTLKDNDANRAASVDLFVLSGSAFSGSSKITSDKTKLLLNQNHTDKATITVKIQDQYGNSIPSLPVHIKKALSFGDLDKYDSVTDSSGIATFTYTPSKVGKEDFHAFTDTFDISSTLTIEIVSDTLANQLGSLVDTLQNNSIARTVASIANTIVAAAASLGLVPIIASVVSSAPAAAHAVTYVFSLGLEAIGVRKRRRSWGRVYDSTTGKGIDMATVRLFEKDTMKLKSTVVTDLKGHYSFQPEPGTYIISVIKDHFIFPTSIFAKYGVATVDKNEARTNKHYVGQPITISGSNNLINLEIPIDPFNRKPNFWVKTKVFFSDAFDFLTSGITLILIPSLIFGAVVSIFAAIILPNNRNITISLIYVLVALIYILTRLINKRKFSVVYDSETKKPVLDAIVSVFDEKYGALKETRITDKYGRFSISIPKGTYNLKIEKEHYSFPSTKVKKHSRDGRYTDLYFGGIISTNKEQFINVSVPIDEK